MPHDAAAAGSVTKTQSNDQQTGPGPGPGITDTDLSFIDKLLQDLLASGGQPADSDAIIAPNDDAAGASYGFLEPGRTADNADSTKDQQTVPRSSTYASAPAPSNLQQVQGKTAEAPRIDTEAAGSTAADHHVEQSGTSGAQRRRTAGLGMRAWPEPGQEAESQAHDQAAASTAYDQTTGVGPGPTSASRVTGSSSSSSNQHAPRGYDEHGGMQHQSGFAAGERPQLDPHKLPGPSKKHVPCLLFARNGYCPRGAMCWFAHGPVELHAGIRHNQVATQMTVMMHGRKNSHSRLIVP